VWSIHPDASDQFAPSKAAFMVNYRVDDLFALIAALKAEGCNVLEKIDDSEYGKFGWVIDPEGNKVEWWQPPAGQLNGNSSLVHSGPMTKRSVFVTPSKQICWQ
jgi:hypothetical protein